MKVQGEAVSPHVEVATNYLEDLAKVMKEATLNNRVLM